MSKTTLNREEYIKSITLDKIEVFNFKTNKSLGIYDNLRKAYAFHSIISGGRNKLVNKLNKNGKPSKAFSRRIKEYIYFKSVK